MSNDYYEPSGSPAAFSWKRAEQITSEFAAVAAAFEKLPPLAEIKQGRSGYSPNGGTGNAYAIAVTPAIPGYVLGQRFGVLSNGLNTGSSTLNVNGLGPRAITRADGVPVTSGDLGPIFEVVYDGSSFNLTIPARNATALQRSANLSDLIDAAAARASLGLGVLAVKGSANLASGEVAGILPVAKGGTGGASAQAIRDAAQLGALAVLSIVDLASQTSGVLPVSKGGSGGTSAAGIRAAAQLGGLATEDAVSLDGPGTVGILPVAKGGTSANSVAGIRANLQLGSASFLDETGLMRRGGADAYGIDQTILAKFTGPNAGGSFAPGTLTQGSDLLVCDTEGVSGSGGPSGGVWRLGGRISPQCGSTWTRVG